MDAKVPVSILAVAAALGAYAGIRAHERAAAGPTQEAAVAVEPPVPAPVGIVADAVAASPDATWRKAQTAVGGVVLLAPPTFGGLLGAYARVPSLTTVVDGEAPAYAVVAADGRWVVAAHVVSPQRAKSTLEAPAQQGGLAVESHAGSIDVMKAEGGFIGLAGGWVLVGSDRDAVVTLGPYAYRTLPTRPLPKSAIEANVSHAALDGALRSSLVRKWNAVHAWLVDQKERMRSAKHGEPPDLATPEPLIAELDAIEKTYEERLAAMESGDLALDVDDDGVHAHMTLAAPKSGDVAKWVDDLGGGPTAPLAASSQDAIATIFWRSDETDRTRTAKETSDTLTKALGARIPAADEAKIGDYLDKIARARDDWALASVTGGAQTGALLRLATKDSSAIAASIAGIVDLARSPSWAKWEDDALSVSKVERTGSRATFTAKSTAIQASWAERPGELDLAAGVDAGAVLASASGQITLASDAKVSSWLRTIGSSVVLAIVARPLLLASAPRSDALLLAFVHEPHAVVLDARVPGVVVREIVSRGF